MSSGAEHRICDAIRDCHEKDSPGWEEAEKPYDRPEQPALDASRVNCVFYYGASFNPPHETHGRILKTIYDDAGPHMMSSLDAHLAGALVGCSAHADLLQKTSEQKIPIPLPSRDRLQLWHEGIRSMGLGWANVTGFDGWDQFWPFFRYVDAAPGRCRDAVAGRQVFQDGRYSIRFARVTKLDAEKSYHRSVFADTPEATRVFFEPLYLEDKPGSGQSSKGSVNAVAMGITITTDVGGQGSCWMPEGAEEPKKLWDYSDWRAIWERGSGDESAVKSIWVCDSRRLEHKVFYVHTGDVKVVDSLNAWGIMRESISDAEKERALGKFFNPRLLLEKVEALEG